MTDTETPTIDKITKQRGVAGQYAYNVTVTYPGESPSHISFIGSEYGGPIIAEWSPGRQVFVSRAVMDRCGAMLTPEWIRAFFRTD